jgi:hypothetical protein
MVAALYLTWHTLGSPRRSVDKMIRQINAGELPELAVRTNFEHELLVSEDGFAIGDFRDTTKSTGLMPWNAITEVWAYKLDLHSTDQVRLAITVEHAGRLEIHEEMKGFSTLCEALAERMPGFPSFWPWFSKITTPAFESCPTRLYPLAMIRAEQINERQNGASA